MTQLDLATNSELKNLMVGWRQIRFVALLFLVSAVLTMFHALSLQTAFYSTFVMIISGLYLYASFGVYKRKRWAISLTIVMSIISMFFMPFGILVGIFGLFSVRRALPYFSDDELTIDSVEQTYRKRF